MSNFTISVVRDFASCPFGRYRKDGDRSAEVFRDEQLIPAIRQHDCVVVDLSGYNYYGSSFLEETFGGLVRAGYSPDELAVKLKVVHDQLPSIVKEALKYMKSDEVGE